MDLDNLGWGGIGWDGLGWVGMGLGRLEWVRIA